MDGMGFQELFDRMSRKQGFAYEFDDEGDCYFYFEDGGRVKLNPAELVNASKRIQRICDVLGDVEDSGSD